MSTGLYTHTTRATGTVLTAAIYNADHQNHITNQNPTMTGAYSDSVGEMQGTFDPGGIGTENLPTSLAEELEALRFVIKRFIGASQWYEDVGQGAQVDSLNIFSITQTIAAAVVNLILTRTENDTTEREFLNVRSGSGAGDRYSTRLVGDGSNAIAQIRRFLGSTELDRITSSLILHNILTGVGDSIRLNPSGFVDLSEISAPADPSADTGRIYVKDNGSGLAGGTLLAYRDAAGRERLVREDAEAVGALLGHLQNQRTAGTDGGTAGPVATWNTIPINTETYDRLGILSISSNQFTISEPGTYEIRWRAPFNITGTFGAILTRLRNISDSTTVAASTAIDISAQPGANHWTEGVVRLTIAASKIFEIQAYHVSSSVIYGGAVNLDSEDEHYLQVFIRRG